MHDAAEVITIQEERCTGCNKCIANCPVQYANIAYKVNGENKVKVNQSRCIHCGQCIEVCDPKARDYYDDTASFLNDLKKG